jgi:hypothetical protein
MGWSRWRQSVSYKEGFVDISSKHLKEYSDMQTELSVMKNKIKHLEIARNKALETTQLADDAIESEHKSEDSLRIQLTSIEHSLKNIYEYI